MGDKRLNHLMVLHIHKTRLDNLSLLDVANEFVSENDHRETIFGKFNALDLRRGSTVVKSVGVQVNFQ